MPPCDDPDRPFLLERADGAARLRRFQPLAGLNILNGESFAGFWACLGPRESVRSAHIFRNSDGPPPSARRWYEAFPAHANERLGEQPPDGHADLRGLQSRQLDERLFTEWIWLTRNGSERGQDLDLERMEAVEKRGRVLHELSLPYCARERGLVRDARNVRHPHSGDRRLVIVAAKDGRSGHQNVGACMDDLPGIVGLDPAIDFQDCMTPGSVDELSRPFDFRQDGWNEVLAAESRIHRHDQQQIHIGDNFFDRRKRGRRIERHPGLDPAFLDGLHGPV